jgi:hypothetical protein
MNCSAVDAQSSMVIADGRSIRCIQKAVDVAFRVVVEVDLPDPELVGGPHPSRVRDAVDRLLRQLQSRVVVHELRHSLYLRADRPSPRLTAAA